MKNIIQKTLERDIAFQFSGIREDDTVVFEFDFYEDIPAGHTITLFCQRPNQTYCNQSDGITYNGKKITIEVKDFFFTMQGLHYLNLVITKGNERIATECFNVIVSRTLESDIIENNKDDIQVLEDLKKKIDEINGINGDFEKYKADVLKLKQDLSTTNKSVSDLSSQLDDKANKNDLNLKTDKSYVDNKVWSMDNIGQDVREAMTGGSVAVVGVGAVGKSNVQNNAIDISKIDLRKPKFLYFKDKLQYNYDTLTFSMPSFQINVEGWKHILPSMFPIECPNDKFEFKLGTSKIGIVYLDTELVKNNTYPFIFKDGGYEQTPDGDRYIEVARLNQKSVYTKYNVEYFPKVKIARDDILDNSVTISKLNNIDYEFLHLKDSIFFYKDDYKVILPDIMANINGWKTLKASQFPVECPNGKFEFQLSSDRLGILYFDTEAFKNNVYPFIWKDRGYVQQPSGSRYKEVLKFSEKGLYTKYNVETVSILNSSNIDVKIILPSKFVAVSGLETNIYYNNIVRYQDTDLAPQINVWNAEEYTHKYCRINKSVTGETNITFNLYNNGNLKNSFISKSILCSTINRDTGNGLTKNVLFVGDSLTDSNLYVTEVLNMFKNDLMSINLLGTRGQNEAKHEGRSGWRAWTYVNTQNGEYGNTSINAFYNPSNKTFDFNYYMTQNNYTNVDYVFINLGTNDVSRQDNNSDNDIINSYNHIINSIKAYNSNIKIVLWLPPTRALGMVNTFKRHIDASLRMNELLINTYDNKENENIYLMPVYFNVSPYHDYTYEEVNVSKRNNLFKELKCLDHVHPSIYGYYKIADVIFTYIKYLSSK